MTVNETTPRLHAVTVRVDEDLYRRFHIAMANHGEFKAAEGLRTAMELYIQRYDGNMTAQQSNPVTETPSPVPQADPRPVRAPEPVPSSNEPDDDDMTDINDVLSGKVS